MWVVVEKFRCYFKHLRVISFLLVPLSLTHSRFPPATRRAAVDGLGQASMVWASLLGALSRVGDVAAMNRAVDMMQASNAPGNPSTYAILIDFYGKHQRLTAMNAACRAMDAAGIPRTIQTYTCMSLSLC